MNDDKLQTLVEMANLHSDRGLEGLFAFGKAFIEAQQRCPQSLSLEVGTRNGGSATLFLLILSHLYPPQTRPFLFTIDPYGSKPYNGGDLKGLPLYSDINHLAAKQLLSVWPNHTHFLMTSLDFFERMGDLPYWRPGSTTAVVRSVPDGNNIAVPVGEQRLVNEIGFCLLDGEHDAETIEAELDALIGPGDFLASEGMVVIDNVDTDPTTRPMLVDVFEDSLCTIEFSANGQWAVVRGNK